MITHSQMQQHVNQVNDKFSVHALLDGYQIRMFKRKDLVIGGSFDWTYYHNIDVIFKKVIFFNLPTSWKDTAIEGDDLFRLSNLQEFKIHHPEFDIKDRYIFAFDLFFNFKDRYEKHTYFVVASNVFFDQPEHPSGDGSIYYVDPLVDMGARCKKNRVIVHL